MRRRLPRLSRMHRCRTSRPGCEWPRGSWLSVSPARGGWRWWTGRCSSVLPQPGRRRTRQDPSSVPAPGPADHARVPELVCGERTAVFTLGADRYSCYVRIAAPGPRSSPSFGIVRIEVPQSFGLDAARITADEVACVLPRYVGSRTRDPRAPQNLQPVGALESSSPPLPVRRAWPPAPPATPSSCTTVRLSHDAAIAPV